MGPMNECEGGCHCGAVRFRVSFEEWRALECNCSICSKKGFLHLIVPLENFVLQSGEEALETYTFNSHVAKHRFCRVCGIQAFYTPRSHPDQVDVNVRCLDDAPVERFSVRAFDGAHWEENVEQIRSTGE